MKRWYLFYYERVIKGHQLGDQIQAVGKSHQLGDLLEMPAVFGSVPEEALARNVTRFLLELGKGFAYVGRQMELKMDEETSYFPDLVFYHIPQRRYLIAEIESRKREEGSNDER